MADTTKPDPNPMATAEKFAAQAVTGEKVQRDTIAPSVP